MDDTELSEHNRELRTQELELVTHILNAFQNIPQASRRRVIDTVSRFFDLQSGHMRPLDVVSGSVANSIGDEPFRTGPSFSEDRSMGPKDFMLQKQPKTDVEKVACLAYYLTHYRDTPHFKTLDLSKLNTEAAQVKFSNPAVAVENATKRRYLVPATKGTKQLSAHGEQFVLALPDRDKAREVMSHTRPRKRAKRASPNA